MEIVARKSNGVFKVAQINGGSYYCRFNFAKRNKSRRDRRSDNGQENN